MEDNRSLAAADNLLGLCNKVIIRKAKQIDVPLLKSLYYKAFIDEDLFPLIVGLLNDQQNTLTLCALENDNLVGHIAFTKCHASPANTSLALLGPLAILPHAQRKGIGSSLIKEGFELLKKDHVAKILVLGDPNYYSRLGFTEEKDILPAYPIPSNWKAAWQSIILADCSTSLSGKLEVSKPWQRQELWSS